MKKISIKNINLAKQKRNRDVEVERLTEKVIIDGAKKKHLTARPLY